jgi:ssRNA-specific RNase YbeY (16S rRNA maturation enzyme)
LSTGCEPSRAWVVLSAEAWRQLLACWLAALQPTLEQPFRARGYSLGLALVSDEEIAALNSDWRGKAGPPAIPGPLELGDIVTSVESATR